MFKKIFVLLFIVLLSSLNFKNNRVKLVAQEIKEEINLNINSAGCVLIDLNSNKVLYEKNSNEKMYPASMTKMMGMLLVLEAIENNKIKFEQEVTISLAASKMGGSQVYLEPGEIMSIEELFKCVTIASANDAMFALAETVSGSETQFVKDMNKRALEIGMKNTNFVNTTGFDDENHYSSPFDMGLLARELLFKYETKVTKYSSLKEGYIREDSDNPFWLVNTNRLLGDYQGLDGLKTGFTQDAGFCLTASAKRDNLRLISVVMNAATKDIRSKDTLTLLDYGFANYESLQIYKKGEIIGTASFKHAKKENTPLITHNDLFITVKKGENIDNIKKEIIIEKVNAPIKKNEVVGKVIVENSLGWKNEIDIIVNENIKFIHWYDYFIELFLQMLF